MAPDPDLGKSVNTRQDKAKGLGFSFKQAPCNRCRRAEVSWAGGGGEGGVPEERGASRGHRGDGGSGTAKGLGWLSGIKCEAVYFFIVNTDGSVYS